MTREPHPDQIAATGAHPDDARALARACAAVDSGLLVVTGPDTGMSLALATAVAHDDAQGTYARRDTVNADLDVHVAQPGGAIWTVAELESQILRPAALKPLNRAHILVADAHLLSATAADRLLKAIEEPRSDTLYWFCVPTADTLPVTLRSRAARTLPVRPIAGAQLLDALARTGAPAGDAQDIARLAGRNARLALAVARTGTLPALAACASAAHEVGSGTDSHPTGTADTWLAAICELAAVTRAASRRAASPAADAHTRWDKLNPAGRAEARRLVRSAIADVADVASQTVPAAETASDLAAVETRLRACAQALEELATNAPPLTVLSALAARCASPGDA